MPVFRIALLISLLWFCIGSAAQENIEHKAFISEIKLFPLPADEPSIKSLRYIEHIPFRSGFSDKDLNRILSSNGNRKIFIDKISDEDSSFCERTILSKDTRLRYFNQEKNDTLIIIGDDGKYSGRAVALQVEYLNYFYDFSELGNYFISTYRLIDTQRANSLSMGYRVWDPQSIRTGFGFNKLPAKKNMIDFFCKKYGLTDESYYETSNIINYGSISEIGVFGFNTQKNDSVGIVIYKCVDGKLVKTQTLDIENYSRSITGLSPTGLIYNSEPILIAVLTGCCGWLGPQYELGLLYFDGVRFVLTESPYID